MRPYFGGVMRVLAALACAVALVTTSAVGSTSAMAATTFSDVVPAAMVPAGVVVSPDPAHDLYVGTGGLIVPSRDWRGSDSSRSDTASCLDCQWRVSVLCTKADAAAGRCRIIDLGCPVGTTPVRVWLLRPGASWEVVGEECQGATTPRTVTQVGADVRDRAVAALPPLRPAVQPPNGVLVTVPAAFGSGQPASGLTGADLSVLGLAVTLDARARWLWSYGDGVTSWSSVPGGRYPNLSVSHAYRRSGSLRVTVSSVWRGSYTVEGIGPFAIPGDPLVQTASITVVVRSAHAHLVG